jgi:hypothetical protein
MSLPREIRSVIASLFRDGDRRTSACWIGLDRRLLSHGVSLPHRWLSPSVAPESFELQFLYHHADQNVLPEPSL